MEYERFFAVLFCVKVGDNIAMLVVSSFLIALKKIGISYHVAYFATQLRFFIVMSSVINVREDINRKFSTKLLPTIHNASKAYTCWQKHTHTHDSQSTIGRKKMFKIARVIN